MRTERSSTLARAALPCAITALALFACAPVRRDLLAPIATHLGASAAINTHGRASMGAFVSVRARTSRAVHVGASGNVSHEPGAPQDTTLFRAAAEPRTRVSALGEFTFVDPRPEGIYLGLVAGLGPQLTVDSQPRLGFQALVGGELRWRWSDSVDSMLRLSMQQELTPGASAPWTTSVGVQLGVGLNGAGRPISVYDPDSTLEPRSSSDVFAQGFDAPVRAGYEAFGSSATLCRAVAERDERALHDALIEPTLDGSSSCDRTIVRGAMTQPETANNRCRAYLAVTPYAIRARAIEATLRISVGNGDPTTLVSRAVELQGSGPRFSLLFACGAGRHAVMVKSVSDEHPRVEFSVYSWTFELPATWGSSTSPIPRVVSTDGALPAECIAPDRTCLVYVDNTQTSAISAALPADVTVGAFAMDETGLPSIMANPLQRPASPLRLARASLPFVTRTLPAAR